MANPCDYPKCCAERAGEGQFCVVHRAFKVAPFSPDTICARCVKPIKPGAEYLETAGGPVHLDRAACRMVKVE